MPPTRKSTVNSSTTQPSPSANHRRFFAGSANAAKTRAGVAAYVRVITNVLWTTVRSLMSLPLLRRVGLVLGEQIAEPIEAPLPERAALVDPVLRGPEALGLDAAGAHPTDLLGAHQPALLEDLQVLHD